MSYMDLADHPHRRYNPLTREWVLVSPHRAKRPWQGQVEEGAPQDRPRHDPQCYLCPGNSRAGGARNPAYRRTFVFDNDYPALRAATPGAAVQRGTVIRAAGEPGVCRVLCFSPRHDLDLSTMEAGDIREVVDGWAAQYRELGALPFVNYVQIFENRGQMMGASNPHPHCQIWATASLPNLPEREQISLEEHQAAHGLCLLCDYGDLERSLSERIVLEDEHFLVVVPFWALWPFETLLLSKRHLGSLGEMDEGERDGLAEILKELTSLYDRVFETAFPYSMGFHQSPTDGRSHPENHLHAHFYPPLLRSATVRKFMVGYEMLGTPQRDITPESAADRLRKLAYKPSR